VSDHLAELGLPGIPAPYRSRNGAPYSDCHAGRLSVTPWIPGRAGAAGMTHEQWREFGGLLAQVHGARLPAELASHIPREDYRTPATADLHEVDQWLMRLISGDVKADGAADPLCRHLAQSWTAARPGIRLVAEQAEVLSAELSQHPAADVLCHGDAHTFNTVLDQSGHVWLIDWDKVVLAARERDLMFQLGGVLPDGQVNTEEQKWFFEGYGTVDVDARLLAYYQCSWSVQDLAGFAGRVRDLSVPTPEREEASRILTQF
jgi:spectinomycin phosphotransferase